MKTITVLTVFLVLFGCASRPTDYQYGYYTGYYYAPELQKEYPTIQVGGPAELILTKVSAKLTIYRVAVPAQIENNTTSFLTLLSDGYIFELGKNGNELRGSISKNGIPVGWIDLEKQ